MSPVYTLNDAGSDAQPHLFAATICVPKKKLYPAVKELRRVGAFDHPALSCAALPCSALLGCYCQQQRVPLPHRAS